MIKQLTFIILLFISFFSLNSIIPSLNTSSKRNQLLLPDKHTQLLGFGSKNLISSVAWINLIQNSTISKDQNLFEFNRSYFISELSPYFYLNYKYNGLILAIVKDQFKNANHLLKKGLNIFPNDYNLNFQVGFNSFFLIGNQEAGLSYYKKIYDLQLYKKINPSFPIIYAKAQKKVGREELAIHILKDLYDKTDSPVLKKYLKSYFKN